LKLLALLLGTVVSWEVLAQERVTVQTRLGCGATPYFEAERRARRFPLVSVSGGKPAQGGPCEPLSQHGFFGKEAETVDAIAAWMLGRPFSKDIR
jgi:hypothetical protein